MEKRERIVSGSPSYIEIISKPEEEKIQSWGRVGWERLHQENIQLWKILISFIFPFIVLLGLFFCFHFFFFFPKVKFLFLGTAILSSLSVFSKEKWLFSLFILIFESLILMHVSGNTGLLFFDISLLAFLKRIFYFFLRQNH